MTLIESRGTITEYNLNGLLDLVKVNQLQWNLSKADTYGTDVFVCFREVPTLEKFELKSSQIQGTAVLHWTHSHTDSSCALFDYGNVEW